MLALAFVLVAAGVIIGLAIFPWGGFVLGIVGILLFIAFLLGFGRRAESPTHDF
jgi:asparagine N-glycosylation enzyme membrane subunit Stt3